MPFVVEDDQAPLPIGNTATPPPNPIAPTISDIVAAAFRQDNTLVNLGSRMMEERYPSEPGYNPMDDIRGTPFEQSHADVVLSSRSRAETQARMRRVEQEESNDRLLDAAGFAGTIARIAASSFDPLLAMPAGTVYRAGQAGFSVAKSAASVGLAAGITTAMQEAILQSTQETRSLLGSTTAIGSSVILGGLIGGGASAILSRGERAMLERAVTHERSAIDAHADGLATPRAPDPTTAAVHDDVVSKLVAAGRPEDEAQAAAAITAAHYERFARQFGKSAEEMYREQNISVRGLEAASEPIGEKSFAQSWIDELIAKGKSEIVSPLPEGGLSGDIPRRSGPTVVDPDAKEWTLFHGSDAAGIERFDPDLRRGGEQKMGAEYGAIFFSPSPGEAGGYGGNIYKVRVNPGKTKVYDLRELFEDSEAFHDIVRQRQFELSRERGVSDQSIERQLRERYEFAMNRRQAHLRFIEDARNSEWYPDKSEVPGPREWEFPYNYGAVDAVIQMAKKEGLDTVIIRGLAESHGGDQIAVLNPHRVFGAYSGKEMFQGARRTLPQDISAGPDGRTMLFERDLEGWRSAQADMLAGRSSDASVRVLRTNHVLAALTGYDGNISISPLAVKGMAAKHPDVAAVWPDLPELIADPLYAFPHREGGTSIVVDARTPDGDPIVVGVRDGEVKTVTPQHSREGESGSDGISRRILAEIQDGKKVYVRDARLLDAIEAYSAREPGDNSTRRGSVSEGANLPYTSRASDRRTVGRPSRRNLIFRDQVIKRRDRIFYQGEEPGFDLFHGSRSDFDRFDLSQIGTGFGEQESGRGLYFTESRPEAAQYMDRDVPTSRMYRARINARREDFAGFDTPLRDQPERVQQALRPIAERLLSDPYIADRMAQGGVDDQTIGWIMDGVRVSQYDRATVKVDPGSVEKALADAGVPGITYGQVEGARNYVVFNDKMVDVVDKTLKQETRGRITISDDAATVDLFKNADASTFMHEMGHKWLAELMHYGGLDDAPAALKADREAALEWLGVKSADEIGVEHHEKWARGFERYLAEGKAPSAALARAFEQFKEWLSAIYRSLTDFNSPVNDEIRGVMDRLLATPEQTAAARQLPNIEAPPIAAAAGAAPSDTRTLELESSGLGWSAGLSPTRRVLSAESVNARRTMADLAETPYRFKEGAQGIAATQGPALDRLARNEINGARVEVADNLDRLYREYRFGDQATTVPRLRGNFERMIGRDTELMTMAEFKEEVSLAMQQGDQHSIPQVQQAAQYIRQRVFEPWKKRAIEAGMLPEGVDVKTADSYLQRIYNRELIKARRPEFVNRVTDWLRSDQETKRAQKERLTAYNNGLSVAQDTITKLEARIAALNDDVEVIEARREEATRVNKFAFERATALRESQFANEGGIRVERPGKNIEKARGGAVFETNVRGRGNALADRASGKLAQIEELERRLAAEIANHDQIRTKLENEIAAWEGKSVSEAKSAMKARQAAEDERLANAATDGKPAPEGRLTSADAAIDRAVRRIIESDRDLDDEALRARAHEITDRVLGGPDGRLPYDIASGGPEIGWTPAGGQPPRGPLAARDFNIPDAMIRDFLEKDIEAIVGAHLRTIVPDVLLTERFGDVRMTEALKRIQEDYAARIDATTSEKEAKRLGNERDAAIRDIAAVRDRVRGVFGFVEGGQNMARVSAAAKAINNLTSMGAAAISSLPDFAGAVFRYGFATTFRDGWVPYVRYLTGNNPEFAKFKSQMRALGIGAEVATNARQHALDDVIDGYKPHTRFERGLQYASDKFFLANLLTPLTDIQKTVASHVAASEILRATKAAAAGKATQRQVENLAESGIDANLSGRIWTMIEEGGGSIDNGVILPNTADWRDRAAADALNGAIAREVDIMVISPGQEKPLWFSKPVLGLLAQFRTFTASSTERILVANLQRRDAAVLQGLIASIGLGMLSYAANGVTGGTKPSDRPQDWLKEGISRGGILGWFEEGNALASKMTRGGVDVYRMIGANKPLTRFASRSVLDMFIGPTAGKIQSLAGVTGAAAAGDWKESDTTALRRLIAFQNVFYIRGLLNQAEGGLNGMLGVEMRERPN